MTGDVDANDSFRSIAAHLQGLGGGLTIGYLVGWGFGNEFVYPLTLLSTAAITAGYWLDKRSQNTDTDRSEGGDER